MGVRWDNLLRAEEEFVRQAIRWLSIAYSTYTPLLRGMRSPSRGILYTTVGFVPFLPACRLEGSAAGADAGEAAGAGADPPNAAPRSTPPPAFAAGAGAAPPNAAPRSTPPPAFAAGAGADPPNAAP